MQWMRLLNAATKGYANPREYESHHIPKGLLLIIFRTRQKQSAWRDLLHDGPPILYDH